MVTQPLRAGIRLAAAPGRRQAHSSEELRGSKAGLALPRLRPLRLHDDRTSNWTVPAHLCSRQNVIAGFLGD